MKKIFLLFLCCYSISSSAATFDVSNNSDAGPGSLRQAIIDANALAGLDDIDFLGIYSITLVTNLPPITSPVVINGPFGGPQIELNGTTNAIPGAGLIIALTAAGTTIKGLNIHGFSGQGILIAASNVTVVGCYIGTDITGMLDRGNGGSGIEVATLLTDIQIGGQAPDSINVISGNGAVGINVAANCSNVKISGNRVGVNVTGNTPLQNDNIGVLVTSATNLVVGGSATGAGNIISGNNGHGISLTGCINVAIAQNNIGVGQDGVTAIGNTGHGILLSTSLNLLIGGGFSLKNTISSNTANGIEINNCADITIQYNFIGTDKFGKLQRPNSSHGIQLNDSNSGIVIGGTRKVTGNIISSNGGAGINFNDNGNGKAPSNGTVIKGNVIGSDSAMVQNFGNSVIGIILKSDNCIIGGLTNNEGNVIVGTKLLCGLLIANGNNNRVNGNFIGVSVDGTTAIPNERDGIIIAVENAGQTASNNIIDSNTIAYNKRHGVNVGLALNNFISASETGNRIRFNKIYCNVEQGIFLNKTDATNRGNNGNVAPALNLVSSTSSIIVGVTDPAIANEKIDLYLVEDCPSCDINPQGKTWLDSTTASAAGAWSYDYFAKFGMTITGDIVVTATDASGNTSEFSVCCQAFSGITLTPSANPVCAGSTFSIVYSGGQAGDSLMLQRSLNGVAWTNDVAQRLTDPITFSNLSITDTTQFRFITFTNGAFAVAACKDTSAAVTVNFVDLPIAGTVAFTSGNTFCKTGTFDLSVSGTFGTIQWQKSINGGAFTSITSATATTFTEVVNTPTSTVAYQVAVTNATCGTVTSNNVIGTIVTLKPGTISGPLFQCGKSEVAVSLSDYSGNIQWQDSTDGQSWTNLNLNSSSINYTVTSEVGTDFIRVIVSDSGSICPSEISPEYTVVSDTCSDPLPVIIANAVTRNGDGSNDTFYIKNIETYPVCKLTIYNRWGNKVYESEGYKNDWDGGDASEATYYYVLELGEDINGNRNDKNNYQGSVTILK